MEEIRGVWISNFDISPVLTSKQKIAEAMDFLKQMGFNVVFPVVWNKGYTLFRSKVMRDTFNVDIDPRLGRDALAEVVEEAHRVGIKVIPWFEYGFACSHDKDGEHILQTKPQWRVRMPNGTLLKSGGLTWMNALNLEVQEFMHSLVVEVVNNYDVDGIQGDDRLPAFPVEGLQSLDVDPKLRNIQTGANALTDFLARLHTAVKAVGQRKKKNLVVSMAPNPFPWSRDHFLQDTQAWVQRGLVDTMHPQLYRNTLDDYQNEVEKIRQQFPKDLAKFSPGIALRANNTNLTATLISDYIQSNRKSGLRGHVVFTYEGLRSNNDEMAKALVQGPHAQLALLPSLFTAQA